MALNCSACGIKSTVLLVCHCCCACHCSPPEMDCKGASIISIGDRRATGKREKEFKPRAKCTYCRDLAILNGTRAEPPREGTPQVVRGEIASGDQVVDASSNDFFDQMLKAWPKINAVEMEGAGAATAIDQAGSQGIPTRFIMIRGSRICLAPEGRIKAEKSEMPGRLMHPMQPLPL